MPRSARCARRSARTARRPPRAALCSAAASAVRRRLGLGDGCRSARDALVGALALGQLGAPLPRRAGAARPPVDAAEAPAQLGELLQPRLDAVEHGGLRLESGRYERSSTAASRSSSAMRASSSPGPASAASCSRTRASTCAASPASASAPAPSSGLSSSAAALAASSSTSRWRRRLRSRASSSSSPGCGSTLVDASTSARSSARRARSSAAPASASASARRAAASARHAALHLRAQRARASAARGVEQVELHRGPREPACLVLRDDLDERLAERSRSRACSAAEDQRARAAVAPDAARERHALCVLRRELARALGQLGVRERRLDVGLAPAGPTSDASVRPPSSRPTASATIVLPAPVSPVSTFRPGCSASRAARMSTRFATTSSSSISGRTCRGSAAGTDLGQQRERRRSGASETRDRLARARARARSATPSRITRTAKLARAVRDLDARPRGSTSGRAVERVRRHERHAQGLDAPVHHRAAGREAVAGRARGRGDDDAVAAELAQIDAVDLPAEAGHAAVRSLETRTSLTAVAERCRALDSTVGSSTTRSWPASARVDGGLELVRSAVVRKPTRPKLTPKTGTPRAGHLLQRAQHRAVAAEHQHQVGAGCASRRRGSTSTPRLGRQAPRRARAASPAAPRAACSAMRRTRSGSGDGVASAGARSRGRAGGIGWSLETMCRKNSRLPAGPGWPDAHGTQHDPAGVLAVAGDALEHGRAGPPGPARRRAGASPRPASNCGLTSGSSA